MASCVSSYTAGSWVLHFTIAGLAYWSIGVFGVCRDRHRGDADHKHVLYLLHHGHGLLPGVPGGQLQQEPALGLLHQLLQH